MYAAWESFRLEWSNPDAAKRDLDMVRLRGENEKKAVDLNPAIL
jgi:hypothetical protein